MSNVYDRSVPTRNLVSTITGVIALVISGLTLFGVLTPEQGTSLGTYVTAIVTAIVGIINIFKLTDGV